MINLAICQLKPFIEKKKTLKKAGKMVRSAARNSSNIIIFGEIFNSQYDFKLVPNNSEEYNGPTVKMLSSLSRELGVYIIGGSIFEKENEKFFNTCYSFDKFGNIISKYRKIHLFDVNIKNKIKFKESDIITPGNSISIFNTEFCKIGIIICHDIRFPELCRKLTLNGAEIIVAPSAFNMVTGPFHCEVTARARAVDNQVFFVVASPARDTKANYIAYGHSLIVNPWGEKIVEADEKESIIYASIDLDLIKKVREELPLLKQLKPEIYK